MSPFASQWIFRLDPNANFHAGMKRAIDLSFQNDEFTFVDGGAEMEVIHTCCDDHLTGVALCCDAGADINPRHDLTSKRCS